MKKVLAIFGLTMMIFSANAQEKKENSATPGTNMSIGLEAALPIGAFGDLSSFGIGGSAKVGIPAGPGAVTVSAGYINYSGKTISGVKIPSTYLIPLKAGYRFNLGEGGFNIEPQVGYSVGKNSGGGFTYAGNIGYMINKMVDVSARYEGISKSGTSLSFIGLRVAYNFGL